MVKSTLCQKNPEFIWQQKNRTVSRYHTMASSKRQPIHILPQDDGSSTDHSESNLEAFALLACASLDQTEILYLLTHNSLRIAPSVRPENNAKSVQDTTHNELGGHDALRYGTRSVKTEVLPGHPLEKRLEDWQESQWELKLNMARQVYGMHAPIKMMMERDIVGKRTRLPVLPSSNLHLDVLMGKDETIEFEDYLNDPAMSTDLLDVHAAMEHKLKLKV
ncbi:hypothetical protein VTP01DRAFT_5232 [Rhizomucor pusillus]|uniref:uncharacterized protein n=1 Tax=Rhizomucor pusillus TaxID=4840 RepID=UPI0037431C82